MYKAKQLVTFASVLLGGLCLGFVASACVPAPDGARVRNVEISASSAGIELGILVDEDKRVVHIPSDADSSVLIGDDLGIQVGDVILSINDRPVVLDLPAILETKNIYTDADEISVRLLRDGEEIVLTASMEDYRAGIQAASEEALQQLEARFEGKTKEEAEALWDEIFIPYDPKTAPPTPTPAPDNLYGL